MTESYITLVIFVPGNLSFKLSYQTKLIKLAVKKHINTNTIHMYIYMYVQTN